MAMNILRKEYEGTPRLESMDKGRWLGLIMCLVCYMAQAQPTQKELSANDVDYLVYELVKQHPNPFNRTPKKQFFEQADYLKKQIDSLSYAQKVTWLSKWMANIGDGHTYFQPAQFSVFPLRLYLFEDGTFITDATENFQHLVGCKLTSINSSPMHEVYTSLEPLIPRDSQSQLKAKLPAYALVKEFLEGAEIISASGNIAFKGFCSNRTPFSINLNSLASIEYFRQFELIPREFSRYLDKDFANYYTFSDMLPRNADMLFTSNPGAMYWHTSINSDLLYVQYNFVRNDTISVELYSTKLKNYVVSNSVKQLVVDVRTNPGGNNSLNPPFFDMLQELEDEYDVDLYVILGRKTFSAATDLVASLEKETRALFIGEPTAGAPNHYGNPKTITLPKSLHKASISTYFWQHSFGGDSRESTFPTINIPLFSYQYFNNEDPVLAYVLEKID